MRVEFCSIASGYAKQYNEGVAQNEGAEMVVSGEEVGFSADEINEKLLECVLDEDHHGVVRLLEGGSNIWLDSAWAVCAEPERNPVIMAMTMAMSLDQYRCLDAFQEWFGDVHKWDFGGASMIHWAVEMKSPDGVRWCMRRGARLSDKIASETAPQLSSAWNMAVQMGDPEWLEDLFQISSEWMPPAELIKKDGSLPVSAIGVALFEWGRREAEERRRQDDSRSALQGAALAKRYKSCTRKLVKWGFQVNGTVRTIRFCSLQAARDLQDTANKGFYRPILWALYLEKKLLHLEKRGSASWHPSRLIMECAGEDFDIRWKDALYSIGFKESEKNGFWAIAALRSLKNDFTSQTIHSMKIEGPLKDIPGAIIESLEKTGLPRNKWPFHGQEYDFLPRAFSDFVSLQNDPESRIYELWGERFVIAEGAPLEASSLPHRTASRM